MAWIDQIFEAQASDGGVVRRSRKDVDKYASFPELVDRVRAMGYHLIETGGQCVIFCHEGELIIHC
jgi:hypothetical protein